MSGCTADRRLWRMLRSIPCRSLCGREASCRLDRRCRAHSSRRRSRRYACIPERMESFTLFQDDGRTYAYEKAGGTAHEADVGRRAQQLKHEGAPAWSGSDDSVVTVVGR